MFRNYLTAAFRNFRKQKAFSILNLLGLTVGLATCLLITLFVVNELSYDRYNKFSDRIYRVNAHFRIGGENMSEKIVPADLGPSMVRDFPAVQRFVRLCDPAPVQVRKGNAYVTERRAVWADSSLFDVFTLPTLAGNPQTALTQPNSVVLSAAAAGRYFAGSKPQDVVGSILEIDDTTHYTVTAVIQDMPVLSHFHFDVIRSLCTSKESREINWLNNNWETYLLVKPGVSGQEVDRDLAQTTKKYADPIIQKELGTSLADMARKGDYYRYETIALTRIHLYSDLAREMEPSGNITYVRIFLIIAVFILLLASVNFMNLSTARSAGRSREVGVRKVLGSRRGNLIAQFLTESVLFSITATLLAFAVALLLLPYFSQLSGQHLTLSSLPWSWLAPGALFGSVFVGLLAGSYPAFFLSAFQPIQVLKGKLATGFRGSWLRNILVVFQFTTAITLIVGTLVIYNQLSYIRNRRLGYDRSQVLLIPHTAALGNHIPSFKTALQQLSGVTAVTMGNSFPTSNLSLADVWFTDTARTRTMGPEHWRIDADYISTMGMTMASGRGFRADMHTDSGSVLINETMATLLGYKDPLREKLFVGIDDKKIMARPIIGVVKDFNSVSLRQKTPPIVMTLGLDGDDVITAVRLSTDQMTSVVDQVRRLYQSMNGQSNQPFQYSFMDEDFNNLYTSEIRVGQVFSTFTALAVLVACLGLFGLITFAAEQRNKEMSIRKVLGAGIRHIIVLLSRDFLLLILVSLFIAFPIAWWGMHRWLESFAYRTTIGLWTFALAGLATVGAIVLTISYQAIKSATANPADSLKTE